MTVYEIQEIALAKLRYVTNGAGRIERLLHRSSTNADRRRAREVAAETAEWAKNLSDFLNKFNFENHERNEK